MKFYTVMFIFTEGGKTIWGPSINDVMLFLLAFFTLYPLFIFCYALSLKRESPFKFLTLPPNGVVMDSPLYVNGSVQLYGEEKIILSFVLSRLITRGDIKLLDIAYMR